MRKFEDIRKQLSEAVSGPADNTPSRSTMSMVSFYADGSDTGTTINDLDNPQILNRINAYIGQLSERGYLEVRTPLTTLRYKLMLAGLAADIPLNITPQNNEVIDVPVTKFGGVTGEHPIKGFYNSDGFEDSGYILRLTFGVDQGLYYIDAEIYPEGLDESIKDHFLSDISGNGRVVFGPATRKDGEFKRPVAIFESKKDSVAKVKGWISDFDVQQRFEVKRADANFDGMNIVYHGTFKEGLRDRNILVLPKGQFYDGGYRDAIGGVGQKSARAISQHLFEPDSHDIREFGRGCYRITTPLSKPRSPYNRSIVQIKINKSDSHARLRHIDHEHYQNTDEVKWGPWVSVRYLAIKDGHEGKFEIDANSSAIYNPLVESKKFEFKPLSEELQDQLTLVEKMGDNAAELEMYINNTRSLYDMWFKQLQVAVNAMAGGTYDRNKLGRAAEKIVTRAVSEYNKEFKETPINFSGTDRRQVALSLVHDFETDARLGNFDDELKGKNKGKSLQEAVKVDIVKGSIDIRNAIEKGVRSAKIIPSTVDIKKSTLDFRMKKPNGKIIEFTIRTDKNYVQASESGGQNMRSAYYGGNAANTYRDVVDAVENLLFNYGPKHKALGESKESGAAVQKFFNDNKGKTVRVSISRSVNNPPVIRNAPIKLKSMGEMGSQLKDLIQDFYGETGKKSRLAIVSIVGSGQDLEMVWSTNPAEMESSELI